MTRLMHTKVKIKLKLSGTFKTLTTFFILVKMRLLTTPLMLIQLMVPILIHSMMLERELSQILENNFKRQIGKNLEPLHLSFLVI